MFNNEAMRLRFWLGLAAVLAIAASSVIGALIVSSDDHANFERLQREEALRSAHQAQAELEISTGQLASAAAFYQVERRLTRPVFDVLADSLLRNGALLATSFIARVPLAQRARFERSHGFPIRQRRNGALRRAGTRPEYFPVTYVDSKLGGAEPLGVDLGLDSTRAPILRRASNRASAEATPVIPLSKRSGPGLIIYEPVYRSGAQIATPSQRRAALLGFSSGAFRASTLAAAAASVIPASDKIQLDQAGRPVIGARGVLGESATAPLKVADRTWLLVLHDPAGPSLGLPILMAVVGISLACLLAALIMIWSRNERMQELALQAGQDALSGLKNRRRFEEDLRSEMARSRRLGKTGALLMLDIDNFKRINDSLGHPAGDRVIEEIAVLLRRRTRETDLLARIGGDEFAIVLPQCDTDEARHIAETIGAAIREQAAAAPDRPPLTASIGIAMFGADPRISFESVLSEADTAMYAAKDSGRDGVRIFDRLAVRSDA